MSEQRPQEDIDRIVRRLGEIQVLLRRVMADRLEKAPEVTMYGMATAIGNVVGGPVAAFIRTCLLANYRATGLGTLTHTEYQPKGYHHSQWIEKILGKTETRPVWGKGSKLRLLGVRYFGPSTVGSSAVARNKEYEVMQSLNSGAVHAGVADLPLFDLSTGQYKGSSRRAIIGKAAKASLKKYAYTGKISKKARTAIEADYATSLAGIVRSGFRIGGRFELDKSFRLGNKTWITKPRPFWFLTLPQVRGMNRIFRVELKKELSHGRG